MTTKKETRIAVVSGDFTLDWNLARNPGVEAQKGLWEPEVCTRLRWQRGGAGLLADLIEAVAAQIRDKAAYEVRQPARRDVLGTQSSLRLVPRIRDSITLMPPGRPLTLP